MSLDLEESQMLKEAERHWGPFPGPFAARDQGPIKPRSCLSAWNEWLPLEPVAPTTAVPSRISGKYPRQDEMGLTHTRGLTPVTKGSVIAPSDYQGSPKCLLG